MTMSVDQAARGARLAAALLKYPGCGPLLDGASLDPAELLKRIPYHGVAGLLHEAPGAMAGWPEEVVKYINDYAVALAMWELRHRQILNELLASLDAENVIAILLKGTALAYDLYRAPATRDRGDTDLLIHETDLAETRRVLKRLGFRRNATTEKDGDAFKLQEVWSKTCDGLLAHHVDLHWQTLNSPALKDVLPVVECLENRNPLTQLGPHAMAMDRVRALIHTCVHRTLNFTSPSFVGKRTYYGGNRLIWLHDIDLLACALSLEEWESFVRLSVDKGVGSACFDGLIATRNVFATPVPTAILSSLNTASTASGPAAYLRARQFGRAWHDLRAMPGLQKKFVYFLSRTVPPTDFLRKKYPEAAGCPLLLLYARRMLDLFRHRPMQDTD